MGIRLVHHDPEWADIYERAEADIRDARGALDVRKRKDVE